MYKSGMKTLCKTELQFQLYKKSNKVHCTCKENRNLTDPTLTKPEKIIKNFNTILLLTVYIHVCISCTCAVK